MQLRLQPPFLFCSDACTLIFTVIERRSRITYTIQSFHVFDANKSLNRSWVTHSSSSTQLLKTTTYYCMLYSYTYRALYIALLIRGKLRNGYTVTSLKLVCRCKESSANNAGRGSFQRPGYTQSSSSTLVRKNLVVVYIVKLQLKNILHVI